MSQSSRLAVLRDSPREFVPLPGSTTRCATQYVKDELARGIEWQARKMSGDRAVVTLLYRCILRWNRTLSSVPIELRPSHIDEVLPGFRKQCSGDISSIRQLAQWGFRQHASDAAVMCLRLEQLLESTLK